MHNGTELVASAATKPTDMRDANKLTRVHNWVAELCPAPYYTDGNKTPLLAPSVINSSPLELWSIITSIHKR